MKTISFAVPCYNSAEYMDKCIESLIACAEGKDDIEVLIIDDGSTKDETPQIADSWQERYPALVKAIHKPNGGHGSAVNTGLEHASGAYFKVVDSDDWLDVAAMRPIMAFLRAQAQENDAVDLVIGNYVYEKVFENTRTVIDYRNVFPLDRVFGWDDIHHFHSSQYLLMHSVIYRTALLCEIGLKLPEHCFYVDNIFVYVPLPAVKTMRYFDEDMYRYFIGREGQSVNEDTMKARIDQHLRVTRIMIDAVDLDEVPNHKLRHYMRNYLSMMMCISSVFLRMINNDEASQKLTDLWAYLKQQRPDMYASIRANVLNIGTNLPTELGRRIGLGGYRLAQKIFKFN